MGSIESFAGVRVERVQLDHRQILLLPLKVDFGRVRKLKLGLADDPVAAAAAVVQLNVGRVVADADEVLRRRDDVERARAAVAVRAKQLLVLLLPELKALGLPDPDHLGPVAGDVIGG